ncbi:MAG: translation elongation factor, partial [Ktedonobacterales bacterium]
QRHKLRYIGLIRKILEHEVFYRTFLVSLQQGGIPDTASISDIMKDCNVPLNETTIGRRAGTVRRWIQWIWEQIAD